MLPQNRPLGQKEQIRIGRVSRPKAPDSWRGKMYECLHIHTKAPGKDAGE